MSRFRAFFLLLIFVPVVMQVQLEVLVELLLFLNKRLVLSLLMRMRSFISNDMLM